MNDREQTATLLMAGRAFEPLECLSTDPLRWSHRGDDDDAAAVAATAAAAVTAGGGITLDGETRVVDPERLDLLSSVELIRLSLSAVRHS